MHQIIPEFILASKSKARKELLERLKLEFSCLPSDIDETPNAQETPMELVERLSKSKGQAILKQITQKNSSKSQQIVIISSDQVAVSNGIVYGKPGNHTNAIKQLNIFNNNTIEFITGLNIILYNSKNNKVDKNIYDSVISKIKIKSLTESQIAAYLEKERPYECAASFKIEGLGISLVESMDTEDFSAIIGLPLIKLVKTLKDLGIDILQL